MRETGKIEEAEAIYREVISLCRDKEDALKVIEAYNGLSDVLKL